MLGKGGGWVSGQTIEDGGSRGELTSMAVAGAAEGSWRRRHIRRQRSGVGGVRTRWDIEAGKK